MVKIAGKEDVLSLFYRLMTFHDSTVTNVEHFNLLQPYLISIMAIIIVYVHVYTDVYIIITIMDICR